MRGRFSHAARMLRGIREARALLREKKRKEDLTFPVLSHFWIRHYNRLTYRCVLPLTQDAGTPDFQFYGFVLETMLLRFSEA